MFFPRLDHCFLHCVSPPGADVSPLFDTPRISLQVPLPFFHAAPWPGHSFPCRPALCYSSGTFRRIASNASVLECLVLILIFQAPSPIAPLPQSLIVLTPPLLAGEGGQGQMFARGL